MKQFELSSKNGKLIVTSNDDMSITQVIENPEQKPNEEGYKAAVLECHEALDELGISSEKELCSDPTCKSSLGHRLRKLRDLYIYNRDLVGVLIKMTETPNQITFESVSKVLSNKREH